MNTNPKNEIHLKIFTQNLWGVPRSSPNIRERFKKFFQNLDHIGADVYTLQETFHEKITQEEIIIPWREKSPHFARVNKTSLLKFKFVGSGLTTLSHLKIVRQEFHFFSKSRSFDKLANKGSLLTTVRTNNGIEIDIYNTHFQAYYHRSPKAISRVRKHQIEELKTWIQGHSPSDRNILITGDLNFEEDTENYFELITTCKKEDPSGSCPRFAGHPSDTNPFQQNQDFKFFDIKRELFPNKVTHPFQTIKHRNPKRRRRLDYILLRPAKGWVWDKDKSHAEVLDLGVSDHSGVLGEFVLKKIL